MISENSFKNWHKATFSSGGDNCVEVGFAEDGRVGLRDTELDGHGPTLVFTAGEWDAFLRGVKDGQFDA